VNLTGKRVLVTGGTGSLGQRIVHRLLAGDLGRPGRVIVFSRDEAKQHQMRTGYLNRGAATDDVIYRNSQDSLAFTIGDVRDYASVARAVRGADLVIHAAALKQVPTCEYFPFEAVQTNVVGTQHLVRAVIEQEGRVDTVVGISTDKACKPVNVMGMTKAVMERVLIQANQDAPGTRFGCVRYGNVVGSRGSVVPLFAEQIARGGPVTITLPEMTRFLLTLDQAVDAVFAYLRSGRRGETYVPILPATRIVDLAKAMMHERPVPIEFTGMRPGEKVHEIMISEEECARTSRRDGYYVIQPLLPDVRDGVCERALREEFSSRTTTLGAGALRQLVEAFTLDTAGQEVRA
jgi:UDP-glucose 4-epimerase